MSKHIAFRKRPANPRFNYHKGIDAVSISYKPSIILKAVEKPPKQRKMDPIEEEFLNHEHSVYCQMIGYLPISDCSSNNRGAGPFAPQAEKNRQLKFASESKKAQLMKRFGMNNSEQKSFDMKEEKMLLRHGEVVYPFIKTKRSDNPRALQLAVDVAAGRLNIIEDKQDEELTDAKKMKFKIEMKKKQEDKRIKDHLKRVEKRKEVLDRMKVTKKERAAAIMKAAMEAASEKRTRQINHTQVKPKPEVKREILSENINSNNNGVFMNIQQEEAVKKKKKPQTVQELKELLKKQVENKKMFSKLHETGEDDLAKDVKLKQGWDEAVSKLEGEKFDSIAHLSRNVKKAEHKNKKKFSKIEEVLNRQKIGKHKKLQRKQHNVREKRVRKTASKMNKLQKKGHIVPSFMMS